jgi:hypothetical protein
MGPFEMRLDFEPLTSLDEMIPHDGVLELYPWMSGHILNRWRRTGLIRSFTGKEGKIVYPKADLSRALNKEMECENDDQNENCSNTAGSGSGKNPEDPASTATGTMTEADVLRERLFLAEISSRRKKSSSKS